MKDLGRKPLVWTACQLHSLEWEFQMDGDGGTETDRRDMLIT